MLKWILWWKVRDKTNGKYGKLKRVQEKKRSTGMWSQTQAKNNRWRRNRKVNKSSDEMRDSWSHRGHKWFSGEAVLSRYFFEEEKVGLEKAYLMYFCILNIFRSIQFSQQYLAHRRTFKTTKSQNNSFKIVGFMALFP